MDFGFRPDSFPSKALPRHSTSCDKNVDTLIVGTGIAGSALAFELEKRNASYIVCTEQDTALANTSSISFGHCRIPKQNELEETIRKSVLHLGDNEDRVRFIYSNAGSVKDFFSELGIRYKKRSFGIIPSGKERGGAKILRALQKNISAIETSAHLVHLSESNSVFRAIFRRKGTHFKVRAKKVVLATGGYAGHFAHTPAFRNHNLKIFEMVQLLGGLVVNNHCVFLHPFAFNRGREILTGNKVKLGQFVDNEGNLVFRKRTRHMLENNCYHECFDRLLAESNARRKQGHGIIFAFGNQAIPIMPAAHYTSGGIRTDQFGRVFGCNNLFAVGECAADGKRNGGRLPGYPFTAAIVQGKVLGERLSKK